MKKKVVMNIISKLPRGKTKTAILDKYPVCRIFNYLKLSI